MRLTIVLGSALGLVALAGSAHAATISFASDSSPKLPTLIGSFDGGVTVLTDADPTLVELLIDVDDDGPAGPVPFEAMLTTTLELTWRLSSGPVHIFDVTGMFEFTGVGDGDSLFISASVGEGEAVFTGLGGPLTIGSASITGSDITYGTVDVPGLLDGEDLLGDFGFTLTDINDGAGVGLLVDDGGTVVGIDDFDAEGSFSGSFVPTPGAVTLLGFGALASARRRRR